MDKTILVIDDDRKFLKIMEDALTHQGYRVITAASGELGVRAFEKEHPNLVFVDALLPGKDGFAVCESIRQLPDGEQMPIVMMTAVYKVAAKERDARIRLKVKDYLTKPVDLNKVVGLIEKWVK